MKKLLFTLSSLFISSLVLGQTQTENFVSNTAFQVKTQDGTTSSVTGQPLVDDDKLESITYYDGLGRPKQAIAKHAGGGRENILTPIVYDEFGRQPKDYLPYAYGTVSGDALDYIGQQFDVLGSLEAHYLNKYPEDQISPSGINAYSEKHFEPSPLNRVLEQGAPGSDWMIDRESDSDHTIKFGYQANTEGEVEMFRVIFPTLNTEQPQLFYDGFYAANELYKTITKDENWQPNQTHPKSPKSHTTEEFRDKQGRVVLKRTFSGTVSHSTHYIYDDYGNLTYVTSPKASEMVLEGNTYRSFSQTIGYIEFVPLDKYGNPTTSGQGAAVVTLNKDDRKLTVDLEMEFNSTTSLRTGPIVQLTEHVPDMVVGNITHFGVNYLLSVQDGYLFLAGSGTLPSVIQSFTVGLPEHSVDADVLDQLCYQYHYDRRNRLVEKKIPQKGWEYIVYDKLDRPVLTQDANLRTGNDWLFTKYDAHDRVVYTGLFNPTYLAWPGTPENTHRKSLQSTLDSQSVFHEARVSSPNTINGTGLYHSNSTYPQGNLTVYTINYYDSYTPDASALFPNPEEVLGQTVSPDTKGLPTAGRVRTLETNDWTTSVTYYDAKGRPIYTASENDYLNTTDIASTKLDFVGRAVQTVSSHVKDSNLAIVVTDDYSYDHAGRPLTHKQRLGTPQELIAKNTYDELGQLVAKDVGNTEASPLQSVDYTRNIRGWLKRINDPEVFGNDLFAFAINYNGTELGQGNPTLYNGNISETLWRTANDAGPNTTRGYAYSYDALNRLTTANMSIDIGGGFALASGYHENGLQYDRNGNIMSLQRTGATAVFDQLTYAYNGNQLSRVTDAVTGQQDEGFIDRNTVGNDYTYDVNGNMKTDKNKGITDIEYNHLNLPTRIEFHNDDPSNNGAGVITYVYDATGAKQVKSSWLSGTSSTSSTFYSGNYVYAMGPQIPLELKFINHPEGYLELGDLVFEFPSGLSYYETDYVYQYKDIWGNVRVTYADDDDDGAVTSSEIRREQNYYPYGLEHRGYNSANYGVKNNLKTYQGQELTEDLGLNAHEWKYRMSDPAIGRFWQVDPLAEDYVYNSTYAFQENKMGMGVELEGLELSRWNPMSGIGEGIVRAFTSWIGPEQPAKPKNEGSFGGINFTTTGGKSGFVKPETTKEDIPTVEVDVIMELADNVYGPELNLEATNLPDDDDIVNYVSTEGNNSKDNSSENKDTVKCLNCSRNKKTDSIYVKGSDDGNEMMVPAKDQTKDTKKTVIFHYAEDKKEEKGNNQQE